MKASFLHVLTHGRLNVSAETSRAMTHEAILLIRKALTEAQPFSWESEHFHYPQIAVWPRPVQKPTPQTPPAAVRRSIELFGREVLPRIRSVSPALAAVGG